MIMEIAKPNFPKWSNRAKFLQIWAIASVLVVSAHLPNTPSKQVSIEKLQGETQKLLPWPREWCLRSVCYRLTRERDALVCQRALGQWVLKVGCVPCVLQSPVALHTGRLTRRINNKSKARARFTNRGNGVVPCEARHCRLLRCWVRNTTVSATALEKHERNSIYPVSWWSIRTHEYDISSATNTSKFILSCQH